MDQHPVGTGVLADNVAGRKAVDAGEQFLVAAGVQGRIDLNARLCADPKLVVRQVGFFQGALEGSCPSVHVFQGYASCVADSLVGDAEHLHFFLGNGQFPFQGGLEGEGDQQVTAGTD